MQPLEKPIHRIVNLIDDSSQRLLNGDLETACKDLMKQGQQAACGFEGSFALLARDGEEVRMVRSLDRPMRYFLAKQEAGPFLVVAERIDQIREHLRAEGYLDQFHPSYTRMVPAHHVTRIRLVGCPDPNPSYDRFCAHKEQANLAALEQDTDLIGKAYVEALVKVTERWLAKQEPSAPIGVSFSGGVDSGAVLLVAHHILAAAGSAQRLKAFTLTVDGNGEDAKQAKHFLEVTNLNWIWEPVDVPAKALDPFAAIRLIEDYKPLDVECAAVNIALLTALRQKYPDWRLLLDGDGGDENFKDYPIADNGELTIRSVVNNPMLYQEGWGVDCIKHSLTYSGGLSRSCVRTYAPARQMGFESFSPNMQRELVDLANRIPFDALSSGSEERLYELKGSIIKSGISQVLGVDMPTFEKRRFQHGVASESTFHQAFSHEPESYRAHYLSQTR